MNEREVELLVGRARHGDTVALEQLLLVYYAPLRAHIARRMPPPRVLPVSADDIAQEAVLEAFLKIGGLREATSRSFVAWLKALADMSLVASLRHYGRQKRSSSAKRMPGQWRIQSGAVLELLDQLPDGAKTASSLLAHREKIAALQVAIAALPHDQRRAVQLYFFDGMTLQETAGKMDRTPGAVRGLLQRAKQNIAKSLGRASAWLTTK